MKSRITKLLALAATAATVSFGATGAWANLINVTAITGCAVEGVNLGGNAPAPGVVSNCLATNNFTSGNADANGTFNYKAGSAPAGLTVKADFETVGGVDKFIITFANAGAGPLGLDADTVWLFGGLEAGLGGGGIADITDRTLVVKSAAGVETSQPLSAAFDANGLVIGQSRDWFALDFNNTGKTPKGATVTISGTIVRAPEPGSLALLGALLIAFGVIRIGKVRSFAWRVGKLVS